MQLGFIRKLATEPQNLVFALVRSPGTATELQALAAEKTNVHIVQLDLDDIKSIQVRSACSL